MHLICINSVTPPTAYVIGKTEAKYVVQGLGASESAEPGSGPGGSDALKRSTMRAARGGGPSRWASHVLGPDLNLTLVLPSAQPSTSLLS